MEGRVSDIRRIEDILEQHRGNEKIAVYEGETKFSYAELCQESDQIVQSFQKEDFAIKGRTVLFYLPKGIPYITAYFAVNRMGGIVVPIDGSCKQRQFSSTVDYCDISLIVTEEDWLGQVKEFLKELDFGVMVYCVDTGHLKRTGKYGKDGEERYPQISVTGGEDDVALLLHTSGTTSEPKRVMLTYPIEYPSFDCRTGHGSDRADVNYPTLSFLLCLDCTAFDPFLSRWLSCAVSGRL